MDIEGKITKLLERKFEDPDYADCFLVEINLVRGTKLDVFIDSDTGLDLGKCKSLSRYLEEYLDTELWLGERYTLEVSSPGISRPLKLKRQYLKNIGRTLKVELIEDAPTKEGKLIDVDDEGVTIEYEVIEKIGKKKIKSIQQDAIPFNNIVKAKVQISFKKNQVAIKE